MVRDRTYVTLFSLCFEENEGNSKYREESTPDTCILVNKVVLIELNDACAQRPKGKSITIDNSLELNEFCLQLLRLVTRIHLP